MINAIVFFVPNLYCRADRWNWCRDALLIAGVPPSCIIRILAYDGRRYYFDDIYNVDRLKERLKKTFGNPLPPYLNNNRGGDSFLGDGTSTIKHTIAQFAWDATWYNCLTKISRLPTLHVGVILIDDNTITIEYPELLQQINELAMSCAKQGQDILAIQLSRDRDDAPLVINRSPIADAPFWQAGFAAPNDTAIAYTPCGARYMMSVVNRLSADDHFIDPFIAVAVIRGNGETEGFYAPAPDTPPLTRFAKSQRLNFKLGNVTKTDREQFN